MDITAHPLLTLVDDSKNDILSSLTHYIEHAVEDRIGQLKKRIVSMIEFGEIVVNIGSVNALVSTQANTSHVNSHNEQCPLISNYDQTAHIITPEQIALPSELAASTITIDKCNDKPNVIANHQLNIIANSSLNKQASIGGEENYDHNDGEDCESNQICHQHTETDVSAFSLAQPVQQCSLPKIPFNYDGNDAPNVKSQSNIIGISSSNEQALINESDEEEEVDYGDNHDEDRESNQISFQHTETEVSAFAQPLPTEQPNDSFNPSIVPSTTMYNSNELLSRNPIDFPPAPLSGHINIEPSQIKQEYFESSSTTILMNIDNNGSPNEIATTQFSYVKEEYYTDDNENNIDNLESHHIDTQRNENNVSAFSSVQPSQQSSLPTIPFNVDCNDSPNDNSTDHLNTVGISSLNQEALIDEFDGEEENDYYDDDVTDRESRQIDPQPTEEEVSAFSSVQPLQQSSPPTILINVDLIDEPNAKAQSNSIDISSSNQQALNDQLDGEENYDEDDTEIDDEYSTESLNAPSARVEPEIRLNQEEIQDQPSGPLENDLNVRTIDSQVANEKNQDLSLSNETEQQNRSVRKSIRLLTKQQQHNIEPSLSAQPVIDRNPQPIPSSNERRSSSRNRTPRKVFGVDQSSGVAKSTKRKSTIESSEEVKKVKLQNVDEIYQEDTKRLIIALGINCGERGCKRTFKRLENWKEHLSTFHDKIAYKQLEDNVRFNDLGLAEYHCTECDAVHKSQDSVNQHWRNYHQEGKFQCSACAFVDKYRREVFNHQRKVHQAKNYECTYEGCGRAFACNRDLEQHERAHRGEKPFICTWDQCDFTFGRRSHALRHVRSKHFHLPQTIKEQLERNLTETRDPADYIRIGN